MFDAERLLGSLITEGLGGGRRKRSKQLKWQLGLGAIGVAMAAWEHFNKSPDANAASPPSTNIPPPPPPSAAPQSHTPPPPPPAALATSPRAEAVAPDRALWLVRAMICAANADGRIDSDEQTRILQRLVDAGLGSEERAFLVRELAVPPDPKQLFATIRDRALAEEIYLVSRLAIDIDAASEHAYLTQLATWLELTTAQVAELDLRCMRATQEST